MQTKKLSSNVLKVTLSDIGAGWEQWVMLSSDHHFDNRRTRLDLLKRDFDLARERKALAFMFGDTFCAMQGKYDPRSSMDDIHPEDVGANYLDKIVTRAAKFYGQYTDVITEITRGNHESSILKRHGVDLLSALVYKLNADHGGNVSLGGYGGWIKFGFVVHKTKMSSIDLKYFHGAGGGGPVTRGVIQTNRQAVYLPDAHIVVNGHTHDEWVVKIARERFNSAGTISHDVQWHIRTPTYKDEYGDGSGGWHVETGKPPKNLGCVWLKFSCSGEGKIMIEVIQS